MAECFTTGGLPFLQELPTIHEFGEIIRLRVSSCLKPQVDAWMQSGQDPCVHPPWPNGPLAVP